MMVLKQQQAHRDYQLDPPAGEPTGRCRKLAYRRCGGGPAPEGIDNFDVLWDVDDCADGRVTVLSEQEARKWYDDPRTVRVLEFDR